MKQIFKIIVGVGIASLLFSVAFGEANITEHSNIRGSGSVPLYNMVVIDGTVTLNDPGEAEYPMYANTKRGIFGTITLTTNISYDTGTLKMKVNGTTLRHAADTMIINMLPCPSASRLNINKTNNKLNCVSNDKDTVLTVSDQTYKFNDIFTTDNSSQTNGNAKAVFTGRIYAASAKDAYMYTIGNYEATIVLTLTFD